MPRQRFLKPDALQHRKVGPLSDRSFRLWVGMILLADDKGRLVADPAQLSVQVFGFQPRVKARHVEAALAELASLELIQRYGGRYACFPSWADHQRPQYPTPSRLPEPPARLPEPPGAPPIRPVAEREGTTNEREASTSEREGSKLFAMPNRPERPALSSQGVRPNDSTRLHVGLPEGSHVGLGLGLGSGEEAGNSPPSNGDGGRVFSLDPSNPGTMGGRSKAGTHPTPPAPVPIRGGSDLAPGTGAGRGPAPPPPLPPGLAARADRIGALVGAMATATAQKRQKAARAGGPQGGRYDAKTNRLIFPPAALAVYREEFPEEDIPRAIDNANAYLAELRATGRRLCHADGTPVTDVLQWFTRRLCWEWDEPWDRGDGTKLFYDTEAGEYLA